MALIDERFRMHHRRADKIHGLIAQRPFSAYEIAQELWGNVAVTQAFLTLSEVLGHLDLLVADGRARELREDAVTRSTAAAAGLARLLELAQVSDVRAVVGLAARLAGEPGVEDLPQLGLGGRAQRQCQHVGVVPSPRPFRGGRVAAQRRRTRTSLAAIDAPVPVQQQTTACSARPSATSRAAARSPRPSPRAHLRPAPREGRVRDPARAAPPPRPRRRRRARPRPLRCASTEYDSARHGGRGYSCEHPASHRDQRRAAARAHIGGVERWAREMAERLPRLRPDAYLVARPPADSRTARATAGSRSRSPSSPGAAELR